MILFSHPTGNANVRAALEGFYQSGSLLEFDTAIASFPGSFLQKISSMKPLREIQRREFDPALKNLTKMSPWYEVARLVALKGKFKGLVKKETGIFSIDKVYGHHDKWVSSRLEKFRKKITSVYAYEDGCLQTFTKAHQLGIHCNYDLPIGYWRASLNILNEERLKWPEWSSTLGGIKDSQEKLDRKDQELRLADSLYVASSFTAKTLTEFQGKLPEVNIIPYGFPAVSKKEDHQKISGRKIKLLFVGGLSQRKGIADLFHVYNNLKDNIELTVVGNKPFQECKALNEALNICNWIPSLPHREILKLMRAHDVFVFPSVFEGFGLVITEAMSQGTPVITTYNTAGADLITDGVDGWLIEAGNVHALQSRIEQLLADTDTIINAGIAAQRTASERPWSRYGLELSNKVIAN